MFGCKLLVYRHDGKSIKEITVVEIVVKLEEYRVECGIVEILHLLLGKGRGALLEQHHSAVALSGGACIEIIVAGDD